MLTEKLQFIKDDHYPHEEMGTTPKFNARFDADNHTLSVVYGGGTYGDGPSADQYEIAIFGPDDEMMSLTDYDDTVRGWIPAETINHIVDILDDENISNKIERILRVLKRHD